MSKRVIFDGAWVVVVSVALLALAGCGGNGSSSSNTTNYTIGGTVTGLGNNDSVVLLLNGGDQLSVTSDGSFTFSKSQPAGSAYKVTVKSHTSGIGCVISNGSGTVSSNVTGVAVTCGASGTEVSLYSFGPTPNGVQPNAGLVMDSSGDLFGTTSGGGTNDCGMVFELNSAGAESVLHSFCSTGADGNGPAPGLIMDSADNLYGTTYYGGNYDVGTVFKISPAGSETILHSFGSPGADGNNPQAGVIMGNNGYLYGTTVNGGANGLGTVFKVAPGGSESVLYSFGATTTGSPLPNAQTGLVMDSAGNLYGTTFTGGANGAGMVYKIDTIGTETVLHSFGAGTDGANPKAGLLLDSSGNLYGTTSSGGMFGKGTVYTVSPSGTETVIYSFGSAGSDGADPQAGLVMDGAGNLYGTTTSGGQYGDGTVFEVSASGTESILYSFGGTSTDGITPAPGRLAMDSNGNLYGTTLSGGANNEGMIYEIIN